MEYTEAFKYCPRCGAKLEYREMDRQKIPVCSDKKCDFEFWPAMHPAVSTIMRNSEGQILMTIRAKDPGKGKLDFPGGFVEYGEVPEEAAVRETKEEIGVDIKVTGLLGFAIDNYPYRGIVQKNLAIGILAEMVNGEPTVADTKEVQDIKWVALDDIKDEDLAFECDEKFIGVLREKKSAFTQN